MLPPKITVITPTLNTGESIETALLSVATQTYQNIEHIIVDGSSNDKTLPTIRRFQKMYKNIRLLTENDRGIYHAMNKGLDLCTGDWIIFLGADDSFYDENVLTDLFEQGLFQEEQVIYGNVSVVGDTFWAKDGRVYDGPFELKKLFRTNICHQCIFYPRSVIGKIGYYSETYPISADWDYNLRCYIKYKFSYTDKIIAFFKSGGVSMSGDDTLSKDFLNNIINYFQIDPHSGSVNDPDSPFYYSMSRFREQEYLKHKMELNEEIASLRNLLVDKQTEYADSVSTMQKQNELSSAAMRMEFEETITKFRTDQEHLLSGIRAEYETTVTNLKTEASELVNDLKTEYNQVICNLKEEHREHVETLRADQTHVITKLTDDHNQSVAALKANHLHTISILRNGFEDIIKSQQTELNTFRELFLQKEVEFVRVMESNNQHIEHLNMTITGKDVLFRETVEKYNNELDKLKAELYGRNQDIVAIYNSFTWKTGKILLAPAIFIAKKINSEKT